MPKRNSKSRNAVRHDLLTIDTVLPWEKFKNFQKLVYRLRRDYAPEGDVEGFLVEEIAATMWRKKRLAPAEFFVYFESMYKPQPHVINLQRTIAETKKELELLTDVERNNRMKKKLDIIDRLTSAGTPDLDDVKSLKAQATTNIDVGRFDALARYDAHLDRKLQRLVGLLISMQASRRSTTAPVLAPS